MKQPINDRSYGIIPIYNNDLAEPLVLILRHRNGGHWGLPKGHAEKGESPVQTARRELAEETGITDVELIDTPGFIQRYSFEQDGKDYHKEVTYFIGMVKEQSVHPQAEEISDYRWVPLSELSTSLVVNGQNNEAVDQLLNYMRDKY